MNIRALFITASVSTLLASGAQASTLLAIDHGTDMLVSIDTDTNIFTDIGALGTDGQPNL